MRALLIAMAVLGTVQAQAAPPCATSGELKLLKAAMLEQALTAAAQSCHQSAEFGRFVAAYRGGMIQNDRALKAFFARHNAAESYQAYKARMAEEVALHSLHDAAFCADAERVFAIALKHKQAAPPKLIATGYEHCGAPRAAASAVAALQPVKAAPAPVPVLSPLARKALALAPRKETPLQQPSPPKLVAQAAPVKAVKTAPDAAKQRALQAEPPPEDADQDQPPGDRIPNAYKPGAYWVNHDSQAEGPPPRARHPLVLGPDGRWYVVTGHHDQWRDD